MPAPARSPPPSDPGAGLDGGADPIENPLGGSGIDQRGDPGGRVPRIADDHLGQPPPHEVGELVEPPARSTMTRWTEMQA